jgi:hypothetical protein
MMIMTMMMMMMMMMTRWREAASLSVQLADPFQIRTSLAPAHARFFCLHYNSSLQMPASHF